MSTRYNLANPRDHTNDLLHSPRNAPTQGASFRESTLDLDAYSNSNSSHGDAYNTQNTYNTRNNTTSSSQHQQPNTLTRTPTRTRTDTRNRSRSRTPSPPFDPKDPHAATWRQINRLGGLGSAVEKMIGNVPERRAKAERARVEALRKMELKQQQQQQPAQRHHHRRATANDIVQYTRGGGEIMVEEMDVRSRGRGDGDADYDDGGDGYPHYTARGNGARGVGGYDYDDDDEGEGEYEGSTTPRGYGDRGYPGRGRSSRRD